MGVSFKVSKTGTRFRPKAPPPETSVDEVDENSKESSRIGPRDGSSARKLEGGVVDAREDVVGSENEVSFSLNLFSDGYSIGKPSQDSIAHHDIPKDLHPYDRRSETLFSAIECGRLPGDILDDIPCKFVDGALVCEVRDYRKYTSEQGSSASSSDESPIVTKIILKMSLENVVKDIPLISDNSWTYGDLMEVESRILNSLQPQLCLDPSPKLDRLSNVPIHAKLNLGQCSLRMKRLRQAQEINVTSNNKSHGKKICIDRVPESSNPRLTDSGIVSGNMMAHHVPDNNLTVQNHNPSNMLASRPRSLVQDPSLKYHTGVGGLGGVSVSGASPVSQDMMMSYTDNMNPSAHLHGKREHPEGPMSPLSAFNKRARLGPLGPDGIPSQQMGSHMDGLQGSDMNWRNTLLQQQALTRGIQLSNSGIQKYSQQVLHGVLNQDAAASASFAAGQAGMRYIPKEEQFDGDKLDPSSQLGQGKNDMQVMEGLQQRLPQHGFMRSGFSQSAWNNLGQQFEKDLRKDDQVQKRKPVQSPRLSAGGLAQSPLSSKSGEFSSGSVAPHYGAVANTQKEKSAVTSVPTVGGAQSLTSSANDSFQRQYQIQAAAKRRSNSLPKTPAMSGVGSPVSVSNMSVPLNANSPSIGTPPLVDQTMLERFSKIEMVTMRHKLNCKKNKADDFPIRKPNNYSAQQLLTCLSNISINEDVKDDKRPLAKSLVGGSMNVCKSRVLNFVQPERVVQGNVVSFVHKARTRMVMSEKLNGTVVMYYGDLKDDEFLEIEDYLPTLPNNHLADLLTAQFCHLMSQEGYLLEDHIQPKPTRVNQATNSLSSIPVTPTNNLAAEMSMSQYGDAVSGGEAPKPSNSGNAASLNSSQGLVANARMLPPVNSQALQMSQGLLSGVSMPARPQQLDQQSSLQQQQQQQSSLQQQQNQQSLLQQQHQYQRSPMISPNMQLGGHMVNKPSPLQLQLLQQQQQQQQASPQQQMQRKMMMGLGTGAGSMGNNMIGLGGLGNTMGIGVARAVSGISAPMGNIGQNPMNLTQASNISNVISQQLRSGTLTPAQAALMQSKLRMMQSRGNIIGAPQAGMSSGARQMNPGSNTLSMLGQSLNRANMNPMQRSMMGPPKMMQGMNLYMNQQQQQQQQQQPQQQQTQQQQLQQQQQQLQQLQQQQQQLQPQQQQQLQPQQQQQQQLQQLQLQQQLQQQQLQQQQQQQPMQLQQQQQETTSPLQAVLSPPQPYPQAGSPSTMGIPQQQASPQQMSQRTPMSPQQMSQRTPMSPQQLSSGAIHGANPEACPASPQLSSQTLGSVGSITNSPMDMQGVNKSNSASNT